MPWVKQFDPDQVLDQAMRTFWAQGYRATSLQDLVEATGVNRASLYGTFGDKRTLFLHAVRRYDAAHRVAWFDGLLADHGPRGAIVAAFRQAIDAARQPEARGCLLVNTALELSGHDTECLALVDEAFVCTEAFFVRCLDSIGTADAEGLGAALLGLFLGVRVLSRGRHADTLDRIGEQVEILLG